LTKVSRQCYFGLENLNAIKYGCSEGDNQSQKQRTAASNTKDAVCRLGRNMKGKTALNVLVRDILERLIGSKISIGTNYEHYFI